MAIGWKRLPTNGPVGGAYNCLSASFKRVDRRGQSDAAIASQIKTKKIKPKNDSRREVRMSSGVDRSVAASERGVPAASRPSLLLLDDEAADDGWDDESAHPADVTPMPVGDMADEAAAAAAPPLLLLLEGDSGWPWMTRCPLELKTSRPAAAIDDSMAELNGL